ncbi:MAG: DUF4410 domain-containing protein [Phycisphaerales bacterium]
MHLRSFPRIGHSLALGLISLAALAPGACSPKTTVEPTPLAKSGRVHNPSIVYVTDFYLDPSEMSHDHSPLPRGPLRGAVDELRGEDPKTKAAKYVRLLSETITDDLNAANIRAEYRPSATPLRAEMVPANANIPSSGWIVGGWFSRVNQENRALESTVGFGSGGGQVEIEVVVSDAAVDPRAPFLVIGSESAAKMMPGGLVTKNPYAMAAKFVLSKGDGERDVKAQGHAIAQDLIRYITTGKTTK